MKKQTNSRFEINLKSEKKLKKKQKKKVSWIPTTIDAEFYEDHQVEPHWSAGIRDGGAL